MAQFFIQDTDLAPLKDKIIVVTGGSSGIGLATVNLLLSLHAHVVSGDLTPSPITDNPNHTFLNTDVTSWSSLKTLFKTAHDKHGSIDHVFSNAGIGGRAKYLEDNLDEAGELLEPSMVTYDVNQRGMINAAYLGMYYMRKQNPPGGSVVLTASASSFQRFGVWDYTTTKHAVYGWMRGAIPNILQQKLPIRINSIGPSFTITGLVPKEYLDRAGIESQPAEAVAKNVAYLMADESRQGQFIYSAGGRYYEVEESTLLPVAKKIVGSPVDEQEAFKRMSQAARDLRYDEYRGEKVDEKHRD